MEQKKNVLWVLLTFETCPEIVDFVLLLCSKCGKGKIVSVPRTHNKYSVCQQIAIKYGHAENEEYAKMKLSSLSQRGPFYLIMHKRTRSIGLVFETCVASNFSPIMTGILMIGLASLVYAINKRKPPSIQPTPPVPPTHRNFTWSQQSCFVHSSLHLLNRIKNVTWDKPLNDILAKLKQPSTSKIPFDSTVFFNFTIGQSNDTSEYITEVLNKQSSTLTGINKVEVIFTIGKRKLNTDNHEAIVTYWNNHYSNQKFKWVGQINLARSDEGKTWKMQFRNNSFEFVDDNTTEKKGKLGTQVTAPIRDATLYRDDSEPQTITEAMWLLKIHDSAATTITLSQKTQESSTFGGFFNDEIDWPFMRTDKSHYQIKGNTNYLFADNLCNVGRCPVQMVDDTFEVVGATEWKHGHYVAYVKEEDNCWYMYDDRSRKTQGVKVKTDFLTTSRIFKTFLFERKCQKN